MAAIQPSMLEALKRILSERYVPHLPPLLGNGANQQDKQNKQVSRAFSAFVLQSKFGLDAKTAAEQVTDDFNDNGIDAVYYHEVDKTLYLLQSKLKANEQFSQEEAQAFVSGIQLLLNSQLDDFNNNFQNRRQSIEEALDQCDYIQLVVAYTGDSVSLHAQTTLLRLITNEQEEDDRLRKVVEYFDSQAVAESLRLEQALKPVKIERLKIHKFRELDAPRKTVFGLVSVIDLIMLHNQHDKALYEKNIRYFIGSGRRGVNSAIKETLLNKPDSFLHLNNGITLVCSVVTGRSKNNTTRNFDLLGASVVNGAQTIASAAQFVAEHPEADISAAKVMVTIIQANETGDFHKQVTRARNLQNPVELSHFAALDDVQEYVRREMAIHGYEYHYRPHVQVSRRTGQHILPSITIDELAKALACFSNDVRFPAYLKSEPSQFTTADHESYNAIFNDRLTGVAAINAVLVFRVIAEKLKTSDASSPSPERLVYRHCTYALVHILMKRLKSLILGAVLLTENQIMTVISDPYIELHQQIFDKFPRNETVHSFFKKGWEVATLIQKVMIHNQNLQDDAVVIRKRNVLTANDPYNQALIDYLIQKSPQLTLEQGRR